MELHFHLVYVIILLFVCQTQGQNALSDTNETFPFKIQFHPEMIKQLPMGGEQTVQVFYQKTGGSQSKFILGVQPSDPYVAEVKTPVISLTSLEDFPETNGTELENMTSSGNFTVHGVFLGFSDLIFHVCDESKSECDRNTTFPTKDAPQWKTIEKKMRMSVKRVQRVVDDVFTVAVSILVFISSIAMGCKTELKVVKEVLKKPIAPIIGFCCQFCLMPPFAFGVSQLIPGITPGQAIGIFTLGCSPGGGASNMYTYLLDGDISLSITMTLISTVSSLAMLPLWMFTLGRYMMDRLGMGGVEIPFTNILLSLVMFVVPVGIGVIIKTKAPKAAKKIAKIIRPFMLLFLVFMFTFGMWVNAYMFKLFTTMVVVAGLTLPVLGFLGGGVIAWICRQSWKRIKTISLETGIQNTGVAIILLTFSLPSPDAELAIVGTIAVTMFTPILPMIFVVIYVIKKRRCWRKKGDGSSGSDGEESKKDENGFVANQGFGDGDEVSMEGNKKADPSDVNIVLANNNEDTKF